MPLRIFALILVLNWMMWFVALIRWVWFYLYVVQTSERAEIEKELGDNAKNLEAASDEVIYKIDIPANRYALQTLSDYCITLSKTYLAMICSVWKALPKQFEFFFKKILRLQLSLLRLNKPP